MTTSTSAAETLLSFLLKLSTTKEHHFSVGDGKGEEQNSKCTKQKEPMNNLLIQHYKCFLFLISLQPTNTTDCFETDKVQASSCQAEWTVAKFHHSQKEGTNLTGLYSTEGIHKTNQNYKDMGRWKERKGRKYCSIKWGGNNRLEEAVHLKNMTCYSLFNWIKWQLWIIKCNSTHP